MHKPIPGYQPDNEGDNISIKNPHFCELTCHYWAWKNLKDIDIVGLNHYRRYFDFTKKWPLFSADKHFILTEDFLHQDYLFPDLGYVRQLADKLSEGKMGDGKIINEIKRSRKIAFVGDSLTEGTMNGGYGWFEPLMRNFPDKQVVTFAKGSKTSRFFKENKETISELKADMYFLAMGCNDIRYRNAAICAMNESEYVANIDEICQSIKEKQPSAVIICISPWQSERYDPNCRMTLEEKEKLYDLYSSKLKEFCEAKGFVFVNPNPYLEAVISKQDRRYYLLDHIHCNADQGIKLYSEAVIMSC